jgi:hypothetical protein
MRLSRTRWLLGESLPVPYPVDTCSLLRTAQGYSVPSLRLPQHEGLHSSPGFCGGVPGSGGELPSPYPCLLAQAHNPRRRVPRNDDSHVDSFACPYAALLDGIPGRMPSDRLLSPLYGLMVSRYRRGYAVISTPERQELHLHEEKVVEDHLISAPYPPLSLRDGSFRETDRTSTAWLGASAAAPPHISKEQSQPTRFLLSLQAHRGSS